MSRLPLVLLPGTLCDERLWTSLLSLIPDVGEIITPRYTEGSTMTETVAALRKVLPARFALAGFSLGGLAALELVLQAPESVDRLALICSHAQADTPAAAEARWRQVELAQRQGLESLITEQFIPAGLTAKHPAYSTNVRLLREMAASMKLDDFERQTRMAVTRTDQHKTLAEFARPTLLLASANDALCEPKKPLAAAAAASSARLMWVQQAGHYVTLEQPNVVARQLQHWLEEAA